LFIIALIIIALIIIALIIIASMIGVLSRVIGHWISRSRSPARVL
jgi:hypothetical protein